MSRPFREKNKDLVKLEVVSSDYVFDMKTKNKNGKPCLRKDITIYGRVDAGTSAFVTSTNLQSKNHKFVEDVHKLPKRTKNDIVKLLKNNKKKVAYLIRTDKNTKK